MLSWRVTNKRSLLNYSNIFCSEESPGKNSSAGVGAAAGRRECQTPQQRNSRLQESTERANATQGAGQNWSVKEKSRWLATFIYTLLNIDVDKTWVFINAQNYFNYLCSVYFTLQWNFEEIISKAYLLLGIYMHEWLIQLNMSFRWYFSCLFLNCPENNRHKQCMISFFCLVTYRTGFSAGSCWVSVQPLRETAGLHEKNDPACRKWEVTSLGETGVLLRLSQD